MVVAEEPPPPPPPPSQARPQAPVPTRGRGGPAIPDEGLAGQVAPVRAKAPRSSSPFPSDRLSERNMAERAPSPSRGSFAGPPQGSFAIPSAGSFAAATAPASQVAPSAPTFAEASPQSLATSPSFAAPSFAAPSFGASVPSENDVMKALDRMKSGLTAALQPFNVAAPPKLADTTSFASVPPPAVEWHDVTADKAPQPQQPPQLAAANNLFGSFTMAHGPGLQVAPAAPTSGMASPPAPPAAPLTGTASPPAPPPAPLTGMAGLSERSVLWNSAPSVPPNGLTLSPNLQAPSMPMTKPSPNLSQRQRLDMYLPAGSVREQSPGPILRHQSGPLDGFLSPTGRQTPSLRNLGGPRNGPQAQPQPQPLSPCPSPAMPQWPWKPSHRAPDNQSQSSLSHRSPPHQEIGQQSGPLRSPSPQRQSFPPQRSWSSSAIGPSRAQSFQHGMMLPVAGIPQRPSSTSFPSMNTGGLIQNLQQTAETAVASPKSKAALHPPRQAPEPGPSFSEQPGVSFNSVSSQDLSGTVPTLVGMVPTPQSRAAPVTEQKTAKARESSDSKPIRSIVSGPASRQTSSIGTPANPMNMSFLEDRIPAKVMPPTAPAGSRNASDTKVPGRLHRTASDTMLPSGPLLERKAFGRATVDDELKMRAQEARKAIADAQRKVREVKQDKAEPLYTEGKYVEWSIAQLKKEMSARGISPMFCFDRSDLVNRLEESDVMMMLNRSRGA